MWYSTFSYNYIICFCRHRHGDEDSPTPQNSHDMTHNDKADVMDIQSTQEGIRKKAFLHKEHHQIDQSLDLGHTGDGKKD